MKVGEKFNSFDEFNLNLKEYEKQVLNNYWIRDSRTLESHSRKYPTGIVSKAKKELKYYYIRVACIKGGRCHVPKNQVRNTLTFKQGCTAGMFLKLSACGQYLVIREVAEDHNHNTSAILFETLPHQRLNVSEELKLVTKQNLNIRGNKKIIQQNLVRQSGCLITLKDLSNLGRKPNLKRSFAECVNILTDVYNCDVHLLCTDTNQHLECLYFQDKEMKKMFSLYPEVIFVDGTYCLHESRAATYIIMVEDSEGCGVVVAVGILMNENEDTINWFIKKFKECNCNHFKTKVIMSDKDSKERNSFRRNFPGATLQICLFHTLQIFNREVSHKKMGISSAESELSKTFLTELAYASSEEKYEAAYKKMKDLVPKVVSDYYDKYWHRIKNEWVLCYTFRCQNFANKTNNRVENINQKIKSVVQKFSTLDVFIRDFFICINSGRVNKAVNNSKHFHKVTTVKMTSGNAESSYRQFLTNFAFEKVKCEINKMKTCGSIHDEDDHKCIFHTKSGKIFEVTLSSCQCLYHTSMSLPCRHILKFRNHLDLPLFEESLCLERWTRKYYETHCCDTFLNDQVSPNNNFHITQIEEHVVKQRVLTNHQKFKIMNDECLKLAKLSSEVSSKVFYERLNYIKTIVHKWSNVDNVDADNLQAMIQNNFIQSDNDSDNNEEPIWLQESPNKVGDSLSEDCNIFDHLLEHSYCNPISDSPKNININDVKIVSQGKIRGRPKGCGNTVIGLKKKK